MDNKIFEQAENSIKIDIIEWGNFFTLLNGLIKVAGKEFLQKKDANFKRVHNIYEKYVVPLLDHEYSNEIQLMALDWYLSLMNANKSIWIKHLGIIYKTISDLPKADLSEVNLLKLIKPPGETNEEVDISLKEGLKSINALFDFALNHDLFFNLPSGKPSPTRARGRKSKKKNDQDIEIIVSLKELLLQKLTHGHEFYKRVILEGFIRLFTTSQIEQPDFIL